MIVPAGPGDPGPAMVSRMRVRPLPAGAPPSPPPELVARIRRFLRAAAAAGEEEVRAAQPEPGGQALPPPAYDP